jgi:hypothetical protein
MNACVYRGEVIYQRILGEPQRFLCRSSVLSHSVGDSNSEPKAVLRA